MGRYLRHNKKPLVVLWGVGFNDNRKYSIAHVDQLVDKLKGPRKKVSVMLGVPYYWRSLKNDTENNLQLHSLIKKTDIIMPWDVGRYGNDNYNAVAGAELAGDLQWCTTNKIDYVPWPFLVYRHAREVKRFVGIEAGLGEEMDMVQQNL